VAKYSRLSLKLTDSCFKNIQYLAGWRKY